MIGTNMANLPYKLLPTDKIIVNPRKAFAEQSSVDVELSRWHIFENNAIWWISWFSYWTINEILITIELNVLLSLRLDAAASAADGEIQKKKIIGSGIATLVISNRE